MKKKIKYKLGWEFTPDEELRINKYRREANDFWAKLCCGTPAEEMPIVDLAHYSTGVKGNKPDPHAEVNRCAKTGTILTCPVCGIRFTKRRHSQFLCSGFCRIKYQKNQRNPK